MKTQITETPILEEKTIKIPTGYIITRKYSKGLLETLSIGDYGKEKNIKADFLGYTREVNGVPNGECIPLSSKWVITLSTQYGCSSKCTFCNCPNIPFKGNASFSDLKDQLYNAISLFPTISYTDRLNIHFARMGEPIVNYDVFEFSLWLAKNKMQFQLETGLRTEVIHPVLTTSLPKKFTNLGYHILKWCNTKNHEFNGQAGLQFSINSTNEDQRSIMFNNMQLDLKSLSEIGKSMPFPLGRKYCLNFAYANGFEVDAQKLANLFNKDKFMIKITPIHNNNACRKNNIETVDGYSSYTPYRQVEENLKKVGFDVIVFVPSMDEENGCVTCGNAVLGGSKVTV
jgi:23S rRNA (adenine2503-C2)-methyltransferase